MHDRSPALDTVQNFYWSIKTIFLFIFNDNSTIRINGRHLRQLRSAIARDDKDFDGCDRSYDIFTIMRSGIEVLYWYNDKEDPMYCCVEVRDDDIERRTKIPYCTTPLK